MPRSPEGSLNCFFGLVCRSQAMRTICVDHKMAESNLHYVCSGKSTSVVNRQGSVRSKWRHIRHVGLGLVHGRIFEIQTLDTHETPYHGSCILTLPFGPPISVLELFVIVHSRDLGRIRRWKMNAQLKHLYNASGTNVVDFSHFLHPRKGVTYL